MKEFIITVEAKVFTDVIVEAEDAQEAIDKLKGLNYNEFCIDRLSVVDVWPIGNPIENI